MFVAQSALELNRLRNKQPVATLAASATATMPRAATPKRSTSATRFNTQSSAELQKARKRAPATAPQAGAVEFTKSERTTWKTLIALNALGDIGDIAGIFVGPGTAVSVTFDVILLALNMHFIGMDPKQKKAMKGKGPVMWVLTRIGIEQIPLLEIFYLRSYAIYRLYKQRVKAADKGI